MHCILTIILIANISFSRLLITLNKRLRRITIVTATLSHRYQIVQNLENLKSLEPHAVLNSIFSGAALLLSILAHSLNAHGVIKVLSYFLTFNTYTVISLIIYIFTARSKVNKIKVATYFGEATNSSGRPPTLIKTTLGKVVRADNDINSHFASLKQMWA
uniref:Uncharacterized protein n=1 Tax=Panagrolaimus sp. PS1159 TaxID=55785 RepID=A0AC35GC91_9BILA